MCELTDYQKYRGKCKELVEAAIIADSSMRAVRGYYHCPLWGKQQAHINGSYGFCSTRCAMRFVGL